MTKADAVGAVVTVNDRSINICLKRVVVKKSCLLFLI